MESYRNGIAFVYSKFEGNFGESGNSATLQLSFYSGKFENVSFTNNRGPAVKVSLRLNSVFMLC